MMADTNHNFIYAYDDEHKEIIVIDAVTGERVEQRDNPVLSLLSHFRDQDEMINLRRFALWCAQKTTTHVKPQQKKFFNLAKQIIGGDDITTQLQQAYEKSEGQAVAASTANRQKGTQESANFLCSRECINPDAFEGARNAARFQCMWAEIDANNNLGNMTEKMGAISNEIIAKTEQRQVNVLLDLMHA